MSSNHSGFEQDPFSSDHDLKFFFQSSKDKIILRQIAENIRKTDGILLLTGETGTGKTMLLHAITQQLGHEIIFVQQKQGIATFEDLVQDLCYQLGLSVKDKDLWERFELLEELLSSGLPASPIVLIVDNANFLQDDLLNKLILLSFALAEKSTAFKIVLIGLPELESKINELDQLPVKQVPLYHCVLNNLDLPEVSNYINQRLEAVGYHAADLFTPSAITEIAKFTKGNPRIINKICSAALSVVGSENQSFVTKEIVMQVSKKYLLHPVTAKSKKINADARVTEEVNSKKLELRKSFRTTALGMVALAILGLGIILYRVSWTPPFFDINIKPFNVVKNKGKSGNEQKLAHPKKVYSKNVEDRVVVMQQSPSQHNMQTTASVDAERQNKHVPNSQDVRLNGRQLQSIAKETGRIYPQPVEQANFKPAGESARQYIDALQNSSQTFVAKEVFDQAALLSKQGMATDSFLLYFYLAKHGNGNAAFKLAQFYDPSTFQKDVSFIENPNIIVAKKWYKQAVSAGHPYANYRLALLNNLESRLGGGINIRAQN